MPVMAFPISFPPTLPAVRSRKVVLLVPRERFLRTSEVARLLHVSPKTVSRWAKEGRLPYLATLGGHRRFPAVDIERLSQDLSRLWFDAYRAS